MWRTASVAGRLKEQKPQRVSRAELERRLGVLRANMPTLLRLFPKRTDFLQEFSSYESDLTERATGDDLVWIKEQIDEVLNKCANDPETARR